MLRPEMLQFIPIRKNTTASKAASEFLDTEVRDNISRSFTAADINNIK